MATLSYDNFVDIAVNLSPRDLLSFCLTNREYNGFCKRPGFWSNFIRRKYGFDVKDATIKDYKFIDDLNNVSLTLPQSAYIYGHNVSYGQIIKLAQEELDSYKETELDAYLKGGPLRYFTFKGSQVYEFAKLDDINRISGLWFRAYTPEGAMIKAKDLKAHFNVTDADIFVYNAIYYDTPLDPNTYLIETPRPVLDEDRDGSKLDQGYQDALSRVQNPQIKAILDFFYDQEVKARQTGVKRYFIIDADLIGLNPQDRGYVKEFPMITNVVIVTSSTYGAVLRLITLAPSFVNNFLRYISSNTYNIEVPIARLVTSPEYLNAVFKYLNHSYLVEINQPRII